MFTDAALMITDGGIVALFYDDLGCLQIVECKAISATTPLEDELLAIKMGLNRAISRGWKNCRVYSDCMVAVRAIFFEILNLSLALNNFYVNWISRTFNSVADKVSKWVLQTRLRQGRPKVYGGP